MEHTILVVADIRGYIYRQGPVQVEYTILVVADIGGTSIGRDQYKWNTPS